MSVETDDITILVHQAMVDLRAIENDNKKKTTAYW